MTEPGTDLARQHAPEEPPAFTLVQYQWLRLDGTVLIDLVAPFGVVCYWDPEPGFGVFGPVAGRFRVMPDGPWIVRAYYPDGYPGPAGPWPEDTELAAARAALTQ